MTVEYHQTSTICMLLQHVATEYNSFVVFITLKLIELDI